MIKFYVDAENLILTYEHNQDKDKNWMLEKFNEGETEIWYRHTFLLTEENIFKRPIESNGELDSFDNLDPLEFLFAKKEGQYFKVLKGTLRIEHDVYIHESITVDYDFFVAEDRLSILGKLHHFIQANIYIGGSHPSAIPMAGYYDLLKNFPNAYEKKMYVESRISAIIKQYAETQIDGAERYRKLMNKKISLKGANLLHEFNEYDVLKFTAILEKMEQMLKDEDGYNEKQWQKEILHIIRLLYPKYILALPEVEVKGLKTKYLDYLLVDSSGHVDILEIKKPSNNSIMTQSVYRDNHVPLRELSGTIMQIEKYIYYLNRRAESVEPLIAEKHKDEIPVGLQIKITNPSGFIIMGRDNQLSAAQRHDFEVVKRKYKNVIDIITYDDLIKRLRFTIEQLQKQ